MALGRVYMSTRTNIKPLNVCSRGVLAASTDFTPELAPEQAGLSSLISDSLRPAERRRSPKSHSMRLTQRDRQIVDLVQRAKALREDQIRIALFSEGAASRCQRRLTLLVRNHYLDRLPRKNVNEPAIYILSRRSIAGNRLMREMQFEKGLRS